MYQIFVIDVVKGPRRALTTKDPGNVNQWMTEHDMGDWTAHLWDGETVPFGDTAYLVLSSGRSVWECLTG